VQHLFSGIDPELVLFDLDGTLVDSVPDLTNAVDCMLTELGRAEAGIENVRRWVGNGASVLVKRALANNLLTDSAEEASNDELYDQAYSLFLAFYGQSTTDKSKLYPGALLCLQGFKAKGIRMGLVTNKPIVFTNSMLKDLELDIFFDAVLGGDSLSKKKPDPLPLQSIMQSYNVDPGKTLMVGDSVSDVRAARAAGCRVACVPYGYNHGDNIAQAEPDLIVERLDLLLE
jgi:phosphoglycolate phosphatase